MTANQDISHKELRERVIEIDDATANSCLTDWEIDFIADLIDKDVRKFTFKQAVQIRRIHKERLQ